jgi:hypothetical protein
MVPDLDLQLQVALKALRETVAPAVDPANKVAIEQLHLSIATIAIVRDRLPQARRFARRQMTDALALADSVARAARTDPSIDLAALDAALATGEALLVDPDAETADFEASNAIVTEATLAVINAAQNSAAIAAIDAAVLRASAPGIERGRAWFLSAGFEPDPTAIRPLAALL